MTRVLTLGLIAATAMQFTSPASAQQAAQKPVARSEYLKTVDAHFKLLDTNHDGKITRNELAAEQQKEMEQAKAAVTQQMRARFNQLDTNKDGQLSFQEFLAAAPALKATESPDQLLQRLDTDHDGTITAEEYRASELAKFNAADTNHDGVVTPAEAAAAARKK